MNRGTGESESGNGPTSPFSSLSRVRRRGINMLAKKGLGSDSVFLFFHCLSRQPVELRRIIVQQELSQA
jgi:hypothetical protein